MYIITIKHKQTKECGDLHTDIQHVCLIPTPLAM